MFREPIHMVTVCRGYADFLAESLPWNRPHLDHVVVVTTPDDHDTREVCRQHRVQCLVSRDDGRDGESSKGRLIERALQQVPSDGWVLHLDADTVLPGRFRHELDRAHLDPAKLYGCDRFVVRGWDRWQRLLRSGWLLNPYSGHPHVAGAPAGYELGVRWAGQDGYVPIGFFQLWHRLGGAEEWRGARVKPYATGHGKACRTDVQFGLQWDRRDRVLIPELFVGHLESDDAVTGVNWKGRQSARFGPGVRESARRGVS